MMSHEEDLIDYGRAGPQQYGLPGPLLDRHILDIVSPAPQLTGYM